MAFRYTVSAQFQEARVAQEWIEWLRGGHCRAVLDGGASRAEVVQLDPSDALHFEARYDFPDRATFKTYQSHHAPQLIAEGLERFPTSRGITYARSTGTVAYTEV